MSKWTLLDVKDRLRSGKWFRVRSCSLCGVDLHYCSFNGDLFFQSHCGCVRYENFNPCKWDELQSYLDKDILKIFMESK